MVHSGMKKINMFQITIGQLTKTIAMVCKNVRLTNLALLVCSSIEVNFCFKELLQSDMISTIVCVKGISFSSSFEAASLTGSNCPHGKKQQKKNENVGYI